MSLRFELLDISRLIMERKCCVTNCNGNYDDDNKERTFRLPSADNERQRWLVVIPRDSIPDKKDTVVCERHWPPNYQTIKIFGKLRPLEPPAVFSCVKPSLVPSVPPPERSTSRASAEIRNIVPDEMSAFEEEDKIKTFEQFCQEIDKREFTKTDSMIITCLQSEVRIQLLSLVQSTGVHSFILRVYEDFSFEAYHMGIKCTVKTLSQNKICRLERWSHVEGALRFLKLHEPSSHQVVLKEQMAAMSPMGVGKKQG